MKCLHDTSHTFCYITCSHLHNILMSLFGLSEQHFVAHGIYLPLLKRTTEKLPPFSVCRPVRIFRRYSQVACSLTNRIHKDGNLSDYPTLLPHSAFVVWFSLVKNTNHKTKCYCTFPNPDKPRGHVFLHLQLHGTGERNTFLVMPRPKLPLRFHACYYCTCPGFPNLSVILLCSSCLLHGTPKDIRNSNNYNRSYWFDYCPWITCVNNATPGISLTEGTVKGVMAIPFYEIPTLLQTPMALRKGSQYDNGTDNWC